MPDHKNNTDSIMLQEIHTKLSEQELKAIDHEIQLVPYKKAAVIEALKIVQQHRGWISDESVEVIADYLEMSPAEVDSVATFYNLIFRKPVGRHVILLCDSISCYVMGYKKLQEALQQKLEIRFGETSSDQRFTLLPNCCLGCCDHAPALMIDEDLYQDVSIEMLDDILKRYE
ncbi:NADH-quinone oxidoreductase subunit NuoE [Terrimonas alba]|jgi:NADH-quinone oxidoreductase subunit E|uniref:NADH-quinone oxidoreductase subunit NuoE n=1 Tax=Terrimonas alba TaxID=3349636 RepID=UPI0035F3E33F